MVGIFRSIYEKLTAKKRYEEMKERKSIYQANEEMKERKSIYQANKQKKFEDMLAGIKRHDIKISDGNFVKRRKASDVPVVDFSNVTKSTNISKLSDFVTVDVETTGIAVGGNRIIEVSAIRFVDFYPYECFSTLINPQKPIPDDATKVNNITDDMVQGMPYFGEIVDDLANFIVTSPIVGHNLEFDIKHLYVSGLDFNSKKYYDTLKLCQKTLKKFNPQNEDAEWDVYDYKLETVCEHYGAKIAGAHRSLADCLATGYLFVNILNDKVDGFDKDKIIYDL